MDGHGFTKQSSAKKKATQFRSRMARSLTAPEDSAAYPTTAALDLLSASSSSAMLIDAATVSSTPSSTGEWFCFLRFLFISLEHAAFSALQPSMPTCPRVVHPRSTTVRLLCLWLIPHRTRSPVRLFSSSLFCFLSIEHAAFSRFPCALLCIVFASLRAAAVPCCHCVVDW